MAVLLEDAAPFSVCSALIKGLTLNFISYLLKRSPLVYAMLFPAGCSQPNVQIHNLLTIIYISCCVIAKQIYISCFLIQRRHFEILNPPTTATTDSWRWGYGHSLPLHSTAHYRHFITNNMKHSHHRARTVFKFNILCFINNISHNDILILNFDM